MSLRKGIYWAIRIIALALVIKAGWWAYQHFEPGSRSEQPQQIPDVDKECWIIADTEQCFCRHRQTNQRLSIPYAECVSLARRP